MKPNFPKLGEPLTLNQIKELRQAFGVLFAVELYGPEATYFQTSWAIPDFGLSWQNTSGYNEARRVFATYAQTLTGETEPKQIDRALAEMEQIAATNPAHVFQTTPSKEALELGEQEALRREEAEKAAKEEAGASVERLKARVKKAPPAQPSREFSDLQKETVAKTKDSQKDLAGKIVYAKVTLPEQPQLSSLGADEQIAYHKFVDLAKRAPNKFVENLSSKIANNLPEKIKQSTTPEEINLYSRRVALKATEGLRHGPPAVNPEPMILAKLAGEEKLLQKVVADGKARLLVTQAATDTAVLKMLPEKITRESLARVFGPNITTQILGPDITRSTIILSEDPEGATHRVPLGDNGLLGNYRETVQNPIFANISSLTPSGFKGKLYDFGQEKLLSGLSKLPTDSFLGRLGASEKFQSILSIFRPGQTFEATNLFGNIVLKITPEYAPIVGGLGKLIGVDFGLVPAAEALTIPAPAVTEVVTEGAALKVAAQGGLRGLNITLGNSVATGAAWVAGKLGATALSAKLGAMVGTGIMPVIGTIVGAILGALLGKVIEKFVAWAKKHKEDLAIIGGIMLASGLIFRSVPLVVFGALTTLPGLMTGRALAGIGARVFFFGRQIGKSLAITIGTPVIVAIIVFPILVALILFIINSGAYIVPPIYNRPPIGGGTAAPCPDGGIEITSDLAGKITGGVVQLLPDSNGARASHYCITPTMVILHSSSGYDNATGADMTFGALVQRNLACQLATDTTKTLLMQPFYETQVEMAWCANSWDSYGVSIELSGECLGSSCNPANSSCGPYDNPIFNNPPPHPCDPETDNAVSAVCAVMNQYKIPWCQIYTHDDVPNAIHTDPEGKDWVYNYFIPKVKNACPNDQGGLCNQ